jgi:hypothetical protein
MVRARCNVTEMNESILYVRPEHVANVGLTVNVCRQTIELLSILVHEILQDGLLWSVCCGLGAMMIQT